MSAASRDTIAIIVGGELCRFDSCAAFLLAAAAAAAARWLVVAVVVVELVDVEFASAIGRRRGVGTRRLRCVWRRGANCAASRLIGETRQPIAIERLGPIEAVRRHERRAASSRLLANLLTRQNFELIIGLAKWRVERA